MLKHVAFALLIIITLNRSFFIFFLFFAEFSYGICRLSQRRCLHVFAFEMPRLEFVNRQILHPVEHGLFFHFCMNNLGEDVVLLEGVDLVGHVVPGQGLVHAVLAKPPVVAVVVNLEMEL